MMKKLILLLAMVAGPAMAADQFDLDCTGGKAAMHYRIDLASKQYCFGKCERIMEIQDVTAGMITLYNIEPTLPDRSRRYALINRQSGEWDWYNYSPQLSPSPMDVKGICKPGPFSGFPKPKF